MQQTIKSKGAQARRHRPLVLPGKVVRQLESRRRRVRLRNPPLRVLVDAEPEAHRRLAHKCIDEHLARVTQALSAGELERANEAAGGSVDLVPVRERWDGPDGEDVDLLGVTGVRRERARVRRVVEHEAALRRVRRHALEDENRVRRGGGISAREEDIEAARGHRGGGLIAGDLEGRWGVLAGTTPVIAPGEFRGRGGGGRQEGGEGEDGVEDHCGDAVFWG
jgi:hypothetical protein